MKWFCRTHAYSRASDNSYRMRILTCLSALGLLPLASLAQIPPPIEWQRSLGGTGDENGRAIRQTPDGGFIVAGNSGSIDGVVTGNHGNGDCWVVKLAVDGTLQWQRSLGGSGQDEGTDVLVASDEGYLVVGSSSSNDGDVSGNHGGSDGWVVKLNQSGTIVWQAALGGSGSDELDAGFQAADGGYLVAGTTTSNDGDVSGNHGYGDVWCAKLSNDGALIWQRAYGGSGDEYAKAIADDGNGAFTVAGASSSSDGDATLYQGGSYDAWVFKADQTDGQLIWQRSCGGSNLDIARGLTKTNDGGFAAVGLTTSLDGDVTGGFGGQDIWIVKFDDVGGLMWQRSYGGGGSDFGEALVETTNGDLVIAGSTNSSDGIVTANHGGYDTWIVRASETGEIKWTRCYGGSLGEGAYALTSTSDGGFGATGFANSTDGDVSQNLGGRDLWTLKLALDPTAIGELPKPTRHLTVWPVPAGDRLWFICPDGTSAIPLVQLVDASGRALRTSPGPAFQSNGTASMDISGLTPGSYTLLVQSEREVRSAEFIKR